VTGYRLSVNDDGSGAVHAVEDSAQVVAAIVPDNPLGESWALPARDDVELIVAWSGVPGASNEELFEPNPLTWMPAGRTALDELCARLGPILESRDQRLAFRPHARHVLSDEPSCLQFLTDYEDGPFTLAFEPALLMEPGMLDALDERLPRLFTSLGPRAALVILSDAKLNETGRRVEIVPPGQGVFPMELVDELVERHVPEHVPVASL